MKIKDRQPSMTFMHQAKYYRKKPVAIRAMRMHTDFKIETEDDIKTKIILSGKAGDWLIQGVEKELYPCKHSVFKRTYEEVK